MTLSTLILGSLTVCTFLLLSAWLVDILKSRHADGRHRLYPGQAKTSWEEGDDRDRMEPRVLDPRSKTLPGRSL